MKVRDLIKVLDKYAEKDCDILSVCVSETENRLSILFKKDIVTRCDYYHYSLIWDMWCYTKSEMISR